MRIFIRRLRQAVPHSAAIRSGVGQPASGATDAKGRPALSAGFFTLQPTASRGGRNRVASEDHVAGDPETLVRSICHAGVADRLAARNLPGARDASATVPRPRNRNRTIADLPSGYRAPRWRAMPSGGANAAGVAKGQPLGRPGIPLASRSARGQGPGDAGLRSCHSENRPAATMIVVPSTTAGASVSANTVRPMPETKTICR